MNTYLIFILALLVFNWLLDLIVETLNVRNVSTEIPDEFKGIYDAEKYAKSQRYLRETTRFGQLKAAVMLPLTIAFILLGGFGWINGIAQTASENMIVQGLVFGGVLILLGQLVELPFSIYDTFVIEERYGFNKTTPKTFVIDLLKGMMLTVLLGAPVFALVLWIFGAVPHAWLWAWAALAVIQLFIMFIAPVVILPLFNKFTPLEDGELRTEIEEFAEEQKYTLSGIFKIDGSKRSTKSNAYFTGFGKTKRIALFDTLIEKHTVPELVAVLAHEIGHCKRGHIKKGIVISLASSLLMFFILSLFISKQELYAAFGIDGAPLYAGFIFFGFLYAPISMILGLLGNILSRKHEYEADAFAAETTGEPAALIDALKKLSVDNLSNLTPHPLKVFLEYSHPPVLERIKALSEVKAKVRCKTMKLSARFRRLNIWNKFFVITGLVGVLGVILTVSLYFFPYAKPSKLPSLPLIFFHIEGGYTTTEFTGNPVVADRVRYLKEHCLVIKNTSKMPLLNIDLSVRLPEPVVYNLPVIHPPSVESSWEPKKGHVTVSPGVEIISNSPYPVFPEFIYHLQISSLPPSKCVEIRFLTSNAPQLKLVYGLHDDMTATSHVALSMEIHTNMAGIMPNERPEICTSSFANYLTGSYQYGAGDQLQEAKIFAPIAYDEDRQFSIRGVYRSSKGFSISNCW